LLAIRGVARDVAHHMEGVSGAQYFGRGFEGGVARAGDREVYWFLSLRVDHLPIASRDPFVLARRYAETFHEPFRSIVHSTPAEDLRLDELLERDPLERWGDGRVTLLGDAAHPMLPHAGQGAAQALEDAVALASALGDGTAPEEAPEKALRRYERVHAARTRTIVQLARRNATVGSISNAVGCWMRDQMIRRIPESVVLKSLIAVGRPPTERPTTNHQPSTE
jgi:2-polyprenyl-6-methoxyphenol hydroxylase-like FAD-dependent oxidoreductase